MKTLIAGYGKSGKSAEKFLKLKGYEVFVLDDNTLNKTSFEKAELDRLFDGLSFIVKSPGVPKELMFFKEAALRKIKVVGEFELGACHCLGDIVAVTGTNGKTTTVSLIKHLLRYCKRPVFLGGNIGVPVTSFCDETTADSITVLESSSFQLEATKNFHPKIAAILNLSLDHLNRHKTIKNYAKCKFRITKNQTSSDFLLINADDEFLIKNHPKTNAQIYYFSTQKKVVGCYVQNGFIYFNDNQKIKKIASAKNLKIVGEHNLSNVLCAVLAVWLETGEMSLFQSLSEFTAVAHRIEFVKSVRQIDFYNDSKATNIGSTLSAIKSFKVGINLILGGSDKGYEFDELFQKMPNNVKNIAVFGETKLKIEKAAHKFKFDSIYVCDSLKASVCLLFELAKQGEVVLLSPACASFDCFKNYEERGDFFKKIVKELTYENSLYISKKKTIQT
jgi:UDP-N-acetylmuramoylalanine--D-glutamate ligase